MSLVKMLTEERKDLSVKHLVEGHTIEAWRIDADVRIALHLTGCAWCKKFKASSVAGINIVSSSLLFNLRPRLGELTLAAGIPDIANALDAYTRTTAFGCPDLHGDTNALQVIFSVGTTPPVATASADP